jgi:hypothetical protein
VNHLRHANRFGICSFLIIVGVLFASYLGKAQENRVLSNGTPSWVIATTPANSVLKPAIWTGRTSYRIGESARDFVYFSVNQASYLYILHINTLGKAELLLPSATQPENFFNAGRHALSINYALPQEEGVHYLQIIASPLSLTDLGKDATDAFPVLGTTPLEARKKILTQLAARHLSSGEWGASWTHYETAQTAPMSETSFSQVVIRAVEGDCQSGTEIRDAAVYRDDDKTPYAAFTPITALKGSHLFRVEALGFRPKTVSVNATGLEPQEICAMPTPDRSIRGKAYFTFKTAPKAYDNIIFDASRSHGLLYEWDFGDGSALASGERVGHVYPFSGTFNVRLKVQFYDGESEVIANSVQIRPGEPCPISFPTGPSCQGGTRDKETVTLEARESQHINLALLDQSLNGHDAKLRFDMFYDLVPSANAMQTAGSTIESYLLLDLFDRASNLLDSKRIYTLHSKDSGGLAFASGQTQSMTVTLRDLFGLNALARAGRVRVSAVLNVQNSPSPVKIRYKLAENTLTSLNLPATATSSPVTPPPTTNPTTPPTTTPPTTTPPPVQTPAPADDGTGLMLIILGVIGLIALVVIIIVAMGGGGA